MQDVQAAWKNMIHPFKDRNEKSIMDSWNTDDTDNADAHGFRIRENAHESNDSCMNHENLIGIIDSYILDMSSEGCTDFGT
ncbi:MAG TPA: hypothetical protein VIO58_04970 [Candidatus Methanoperedens sp.]